MQKLTKELIDYALNNPKQKTWSGDDPSADFIDGVFTGQNWNDARLNLLRQTIYRLAPDYDDSCEIEEDNGEFKLFRCYREDSSYVFITYRDYDYEKDNNDIWHIEWYKSRGRTDKVNLNGKPITLEQLKDLLYRLNGIKTK